MNVQIIKTNRTETGTYVEAACENKSALVAITPHGVQVICQNAAHQAWRGQGRLFPGVVAAIAGYKSGEMKAIIRAAQSVCDDQSIPDGALTLLPA